MQGGLLAFTVLLGVSGAAAQNLKLAGGGRSAYVIAVHAPAPPPERFAADELQKYIRLISGATLPVVEAASGRPSILVGDVAGSIPALSNRSVDSYAIHIANGNVSIAGASPRATLFSAYRFLEKYLGCGWLVPGDDHIPRQAELNIPEKGGDVETPAFEYRAIALFPYDESQLNDRLRSDSLFP